MLMRLGGVAAPIVRPRLFCRDVVAGTEAAAFGLQQDDAGFCILICLQEGSKRLMLQLNTYGVELFRTIQGDDTDLFVRFVPDYRVGHNLLSSAKPHSEPAGRLPRDPRECRQPLECSPREDTLPAPGS